MAQESSIEGVVWDASKAVVPGAEVTVANLATGAKGTAITSEVGFYKVPLLRDGTYKVTCSMSGFSTQETQIGLQVGQVARVDFHLKIGAPSETVTVSAAGAKLQSKAQDVGQVIDEKRVQELPLNGRNYLELAQLSTGVVRNAQGGRGEQNAGEGSVRAAGLSSSQANVVLDGSDNSARVSNGPLLNQAQAVKPPPEAVSEFKVLTNNVSAEYGYRMGAKVIVSTKSGTNEYHGTAYEFHRNAATAANNFMFNKYNKPGTTGMKAPQYIRNQYGAMFGGPIFRDRTFFMGSWEGSRIRSTGSDFTLTVPSTAVRGGDFSLEPGGVNRNSEIYDPLTLTGTGTAAVRQPFANKRIPQSRWDPITAKLMALFPKPNCTTPGCENLTNNCFSSTRDKDDSDQFTVRIDHNFNQLHRVFGRYTLRNQELIFGPEMPFPAVSGRTNVLDAQNLAINYSAALSNRTHNEFRFGWSWFPTLRGDFHTEDLNKAYGIQGAPNSSRTDEFAYGLAAFNIAGFRALGGNVGGGRLRNNQKLYHYADNFLMQRGKHSIKLGGEYRRTEFNRMQGGSIAGGAPISGSFGFQPIYTQRFPNQAASANTTGNSFASFLLGLARSQDSGPLSLEVIQAPYYGFYVQDDWQVTPRLTLNLGLRWELFDGPYYPNADEQPISRFTFTGRLIEETVSPLNVRFTGWKVPSGDDDCACDRVLTNWAPRVGIAYRLTDKTVLRAGAGIYYGESDFLQYESGRYQIGPPRQAGGEGQVTAPNETTTLTLSSGFKPLSPLFSADILTLPGTSRGVDYIESFLPTPYTSQWFLDVQHELPWDVVLNLGYTGSASVHLPWWRLPTAPLEPHPFLTWNSATRRRWPQDIDPTRQGNVTSLTYRSNLLNGNYNSFTLKGEKRFSGGFTFLSAFTWSKNIDYGRATINSNTETQSAAGTVSQHIKDLAKNRARSDLNRDFAYNLSFLYELPMGPNRRFLSSGPLSWILGGWQVGGILSLQSGPPMSHSVTPDTQNTLGVYRGEQMMSPTASGTCRNGGAVGTVDCWFNPNFVIAGTPGTFGSAGRNLITGPVWKNFDLSVSKEFRMPIERHRLQFRFEAFNLTNTTHLGRPNLTVGSIDAGLITVADAPRIIQFALKYIF